MKRNFYPKLIAAAAALLLLFALPAAAYAADASVKYVGSYFGFAPDDGSTGGNGLFLENFQNMMPGGTYTQTVTISNTSGNQINVYLRGDPGTESVAGLLKLVTFSIADQNGTLVADTQTAKSWPDNGYTTNSTEKYLSLGTFYSGDTRTLTVTLNVPASMGNEYQDAKGTVKWVFQADVYEPYNPPVNTPTPTTTIPLNPGITITTGGGTQIPLSPGTGDTTNFLLWGAGAVVLAAGLVALIVVRRRKA